MEGSRAAQRRLLLQSVVLLGMHMCGLHRVFLGVEEFFWESEGDLVLVLLIWKGEGGEVEGGRKKGFDNVCDVSGCRGQLKTHVVICQPPSHNRHNRRQNRQQCSNPPTRQQGPMPLLNFNSQLPVACTPNSSRTRWYAAAQRPKDLHNAHLCGGAFFAGCGWH